MCLNRNPSNTFGRRTEEERHLLCEFCCTDGSLCNRNLDCDHTLDTCEYLVLRIHYVVTNTVNIFDNIWISEACFEIS